MRSLPKNYLLFLLFLFFLKKKETFGQTLLDKNGPKKQASKFVNILLHCNIQDDHRSD